jgi:hypothetical protein
VPPSIVTSLGPDAVIKAGKIVWSTKVPLPAVPITNRYLPGPTVPGMKVKVRDPRFAPSTCAPPISGAVRTAVRCWRSNPERSRFARMFSIRNAFPVLRERLSDDRRIWPPPSPNEPRVVDVAPDSRSVAVEVVLASYCANPLPILFVTSSLLTPA